MEKGLRVAVVLCVLGLAGPFVGGQEPAQEKEKPAETKAAPQAPVPKEESSVTAHSIQIGGRTIPYKATAGTILLKDDKDEPNASIFYVAYVRSDVKELSQRPLSFLYNGGPGSSSAWLHMGAFGPRRVATLNAEATPPAPYRLDDNEYSLLDKSDLVFIDPVGTGFSRAVGKAKDKDFWGIDQDVKSLAQFITSYVSRNNRWNSPKFLVGESYGTFRNAALVNYLQSHSGMDFNGVVMVSMVLDLGTISFNPGEDLPYILYLPSYAATAWYHKVPKDPPADLNSFLEEVRHFASTEYADALMKGRNLGTSEKAAIAKKLSQYSGLSEDYISKANLRVNLPQFMQELQRSRELTTGRLDARFSGPTFNLLAEYGDYDPQETAITGAFTAELNTYIREELKFGQDKNYLIESEEVGKGWDWKHVRDRGFGFPGSPNVEGDLVQAMIANTHLRVEIENGIYDLATPFFEAEYTIDHLGLPEKLRSHIQLKYYDAGHMMYLRQDDLAKLKSNVGSFIESASRP